MAAMLEQAWDGDWYRRAYFDDGTPLGSAQSAGVPDRRDLAELGRALGRRAAGDGPSAPWTPCACSWCGATPA